MTNKERAKKESGLQKLQWIKELDGIETPQPLKGGRIPLFAFNPIEVMDSEDSGYYLYSTYLTPIVPEGFYLTLKICNDWVEFDVIAYTDDIEAGERKTIAIRVKPIGPAMPQLENHLVFIGYARLLPVQEIQSIEKVGKWEAFTTGVKSLFNFNKNQN